MSFASMRTRRKASMGLAGWEPSLSGRRGRADNGLEGPILTLRGSEGCCGSIRCNCETRRS